MHVLTVPAWWPSPEQPMAGVFVRDYLRALSAAGMRVGLVFPDLVSLRRWRPGRAVTLRPVIHEENVEQAPVVRVRGLHTALGRPALHLRRFLAWLRRGLAQYEQRHGPPDAIHAHCAIPAGWAALHVEPRLSDRVVITEHTGPFSLALRPPAAAPFVLDALRSAAAVVAVSPHLADQMRAAGVNRDIPVIPNPVSPQFSFSPPPPLAADPRGRRCLQAIFVGRLTRQKGVGELADAMRILAGDQAPAVHLHVAGDGPALRLFRSCPVLDTAVTLHGLCDKGRVAELLRAAHFLVLPSHYENCPLALAEALCSGRPVVATGGSGCQAWMNAADGILCPPHDATALAAAVRTMCLEYSRWDYAAIAARAAKRFSYAAVADPYKTLLEAVASRS